MRSGSKQQTINIGPPLGVRSFSGLLLAVSGGVDSVVLCEMCSQAGYNFSIAHCNFQLRGAESDADELFVSELAKKYGVKYFVEKFDTEKYASDHKISIQVAARKLRYDWFASLLGNKKLQLQYLLTAHHADDNIETILMNFFKGSGINGLKGILPKQNKILRPLLGMTKDEIVAYAKEKNLEYREDSSNSSDKYTRNYFRNQLIPGLEKVFPQVKENLMHNADRFRDINLIYTRSIEERKKKLLLSAGEEVQVPVFKLLKEEAPGTILYEIIKDYGFTAAQVPEVQKLLSSESGKYCSSGSHRILRNRNWLIIAPLQSVDANQYLVEKATETVSFQLGELVLSEPGKPVKLDAGPNVAQLDATEIRFPLLLRKWKKGDYFYPLGMKKKKKLSRFFGDIKLSLNQKEKVWVIESQKKIIWVVGYRIDDRFKISKNTGNILRIELRPAK